MSRGTFFSTDDPSLAPWTLELDNGIRQLMPAFANGSASSILVRRPEEYAGLGVSLADGYTLREDTPVALYFGVIRAWEPPGEYVMALPPFRRSLIQ